MPKINRGGRPRCVDYEKLGFTFIKTEKSYTACCNYCRVILKNTSSSRLRLHRNNCESSRINVDLNEEMETETSDIALEIPVHLNNNVVNNSTPSDAFVLDINLDKPSTSSTSSSVYENLKADDVDLIHSTQKSKKTLKKGTLNKFIDLLGAKEEGTITESIAKFFYACNIPFQVIESEYFINMVLKLRPAYAKKIPNRKALGGYLLDSAYDNIIKSTKLDTNSVLLIDGWKNSSTNTKTITCALTTVDGVKTFLNAWDVTTESETAHKLSTIVYEAMELAKETYNTNIYAMVSDNASAIVKMGKDLKHVIWHSTCNSHTANLLAKDVQDTSVSNNVTAVLKEFKRSDLEKLLVEKGGSRIHLSCETRWCSYRDAYKCLVKNIQYIRIIAAESMKEKKIKSNVISLIFKDDFIEEVKNNINLFDPICNLINKCQSANASVADAAHYWLELHLPEQFNEKFSNKLEHRKNMALNVYALTAYYLHPEYDNSKLSSNHMNLINNFLFKALSNNGCDEWDSFKRKVNIFHELNSKNISKPLLYWRMAEMYCKELPKIALKLLQIPASSGEIERVFSNWGYIHSPIRNRLSFEKSKKLIHIYYSLKMKEKTLDVSYCNNENDDYISEM